MGYLYIYIFFFEILYVDMWCPCARLLLLAAQVVVGLPNVGRPLKHGEL